MNNELERKISEAIQDTSAMGAMDDADAVGTAGSEDCGDMLRIWVKFREENGKKVIDRATYQTFGCQTALAVASTAAKLLRGRTPEEALSMKGGDLAAPLGPLPPMKIHCAQLVESALQQALRQETSGTAASPTAPDSPPITDTLLQSVQAKPGKTIVFQSTNPKNP